MKITQEPPLFMPVTITLQSVAELVAMVSLLGGRSYRATINDTKRDRGLVLDCNPLGGMYDQLDVMASAVGYPYTGNES